MMRIITCEEPNRLVLKSGSIPIPLEGEALIRIRRIGICGTDLHAYKGNQPFFTYPRILGHELAAEVVEIGPHEEGISPGDLVSIIPYIHCGTCIACRNGKTQCCKRMSVIGVHRDGGMRDYMTVPKGHLMKAEGLTPDQTAIVECLSIGTHAVRRAQLQRGERVLVIGAGPIGLGTMKMAKLAGAEVIAMDTNEARLLFAKRWADADHTIHALHEPLAEVDALTGGDFATAVLDATGNARSMEQALHYVAHSGRLLYVGLVKGDITFSDPEFHKREMSILGCRNANREDFAAVMAAIRSGDIDTDSFITHRTSFESMVGEFDSWLLPETGVIKAVVELD